MKLLAAPLFYSTGSHLGLDEGSPLYEGLTMVRGQQQRKERFPQLYLLHQISAQI